MKKLVSSVLLVCAFVLGQDAQAQTGSNPLPWMSGYQFQVSSDQTFQTNMVVDTKVEGVTLEARTIQFRVPTPGGYWWRVRGLNSEGPTVWSTRVFDVKGEASVEREEPMPVVSNVVTNEIELIASESGESAVLHDPAGRTVLAKVLAGCDRTIDLRNLPPGSYFLRIGSRAPVKILIVR